MPLFNKAKSSAMRTVPALRSVLVRLVTGLLLGGTLVASAPTAGAQPFNPADSYLADPLGLIAGYDMTSFYTTVPDSFEVFICYPDAVSVTIDDITTLLNQSELSNYWNSVSNDQYSVTYAPGTTVVSDSPIKCHSDARAAASKRYRGGLIVGPIGGIYPQTFWGYGVDFTIFPNPDDLMFGNTSRWDKIFEWVKGYEQPWTEAIGKSLGYMLGFPNSYTGVLVERDLNRNTDNPMDMMSAGAAQPGYFDVGTIAVNRYAAGWIPPSDVHIYRGGVEQVTLHAGWENGTQMLVVPSGEQGYFLTVGARVAKRHDRGIPKEGVESYLVDQRYTACDGDPDKTCGLTGRRHIPWPHVTTTVRHPLAETYNIPDHVAASELTDPTRHVLTPGEQYTWNDTTIRVLSRTGDAYQIEISDTAPPTDLFVDDNGNTHEADINRIAQMGITVGCATQPEPRYCPDRPVSRAEMAAFLLRALGQPQPQPDTTSGYGDITPDKWYTNYAYTIIQMGIDQGANDKWRPNDPLTRLEMAQWLTRAFDHITPVSTPEGKFDDVHRDYWAVVEGMHQAGITKGCSAQPLLYCPTQPVTRAQMASFIIRAIS